MRHHSQHCLVPKLPACSLPGCGRCVVSWRKTSMRVLECASAFQRKKRSCSLALLAWQSMSKLLYSLQRSYRISSSERTERVPCHQHQMLLSNEKLALQVNSCKASSRGSPTTTSIPAIPWLGSRSPRKGILSRS